MRVLLTETVAGDSAGLAAEARSRGHVVATCQPADRTVSPCVGIAGTAECPLDGHVDAVVAVRRDEDAIATRELGAVCAMRGGVPIVVVGRNVLGDAAVAASEQDALRLAVGQATVADGRPTPAEVARQVDRLLARLGSRNSVEWVGYRDGGGAFDVVVVLAHPLTTSAQQQLDAALIALFWQADPAQPLGRLVYEFGTGTCS